MELELFKGYLYRSVSGIFFSFFLVLFFISSVVLLISLAGVTLIVKMTFADLAQIFIYSLPGSVFFIIPITFVSACIIALLRLSNDNELLVVFSLGFSSSKLTRIFVPLSIFVSFVLLIFSLVLIPISKNAYERFIDFKRTHIDVNLSPGDLGQKLGQWLVYVGDIENGNDIKIYKDLVLFQSNKDESFILAKRGLIENKDGVFAIKLKDGSAYFAKDGQVEKISFKNMQIKSQNKRAIITPYDLYSYWSSAFKGNKALKRKFIQAIITSIFPIVSIFLIQLIGIRNPRVQKNRSVIYMLLSMILYFGLMHVLGSVANIALSMTLPVAFFLVTYILYERKIRRIY